MLVIRNFLIVTVAAFMVALAASAQSKPSKLARIFVPDMLQADLAYLEQITGPAWETYKNGKIIYKTYKVDGCEVTATISDDSVSTLGLAKLSSKCTFNLNKFLTNANGKLPAPHVMTFGQFDDFNGDDGQFWTDCLTMCGNAADPSVYLHWQGPHAENWIEVQLEVVLVDDAAIEASEKWSEAMEKAEGEDWVLETKFNCSRTKYDKIAHKIFRDVRISAITIGYGLDTPITAVSGCSPRNDATTDEPNGKPQSKAASTAGKPQEKPPTTASLGPAKKQSGPKDGYIPPTAEELAPMRPEYLAELAKIDEPPEMANKPMRARKSVSAAEIKTQTIWNAYFDLPKNASHNQRATVINDMLELAKSKELDDSTERTDLYGAIAKMTCTDGADAQTVIGYANNAIDDERGNMLALRARMYLKAGKIDNALDDLEKIMVNDNDMAIINGGVDPRKDSVPCSWSIADFDAFGDAPRALAAKGLYLSSFLGFGAQDRGTVKETDIRDLYTRSSKSWRSPIPHYLAAISTNGLGSEHFNTGIRCLRIPGLHVPENENACASYDEGIRQQIRELTMALVIDPTFVPALSERAAKYLQLAQGSHANGEPSRRLFELAIKDYTAALAAGSKNKHTLYCDRALAQASIGMYREAIDGYEQGMKYAKNGIEDSPFVYMQLAGLYMKMERFNDASDIISQALMNMNGSSMTSVLFRGIKSFRVLYPEYELLPDEILAETVRRRYFPDFPMKWNDEFISGNNLGDLPTTLADLYIIRGDAYMKADRYKEALADYHRVKSNAFIDSLKNIYFDESGRRDYDFPTLFPPPPAK